MLSCATFFRACCSDGAVGAGKRCCIDGLVCLIFTVVALGLGLLGIAPAYMSPAESGTRSLIGEILTSHTLLLPIQVQVGTLQRRRTLRLAVRHGMHNLALRRRRTMIARSCICHSQFVTILYMT